MDSVFLRLPVVRSRVSFVCLAAVVSTASSAIADTKVTLFNTSPSKSFSVTRNGSEVATTNSSQSGVISFGVAVVPGDMLAISETGTAAPPSIPGGVSVAGDDVGCAQVTWSDNPEVDVVGYRVYYADTPAVGGQYDNEVEVTGTSSSSVCGLADGTWYFAVRAVNAAGILSGLSVEVSASVSNGSAQPPLPPSLVQGAESPVGCMTVAWFPSGDPGVVGYVVEYGKASVAGGGASQYDFSVDAGGGTGVTLCSLESGTYYAAVRSRNGAGRLSGWSQEVSVTITVTPVLITAFNVTAADWGVELAWDIWSDESIDGFMLYRNRDGESPEAITGVLPPQTRSWFDDDVSSDTRYSYRLVVVETDGGATPSVPRTVTTEHFDLILEQNTPNPFNPTTRIAFALPEAGPVLLRVYDARGSAIATLVDGVLPFGRHEITWDGTNTEGRHVASGVYFYALVSPKNTQTRKMILVK